jgi:hypothetical protein
MLRNGNNLLARRRRLILRLAGKKAAGCGFMMRLLSPTYDGARSAEVA